MLPTPPPAEGRLALGTTSLSHSQQETLAGGLPTGRTPTATLAGTGRKLKKKSPLAKRVPVPNALFFQLEGHKGI